MSLFKRIIKSQFVKKFACKIVFYYVKIMLLTSRKTIIYKDFDFEEHKNTQCILATWHGRVLIMPIINPFKLPACAIVSDHNDGRLIGDVIKQQGVELIYGSSNRRRLSSLKEILTYIKRGYNFLITPDGPRGPAQTINGAIINIASTTGLPIIPAICAYKKFKQFRSWDKFMFPFLFNEIVIIFDKPIYIPRDINLDDREKYMIKLRDSLNEITKLSDQKILRKT